MPLGRLPNTQIYVLDAARAPVPVGVPGELYIGGDGVARGYLAEPELTRERFVPDPFGARVGDDGALPQTPRRRLYRTGDRARWLSDGTLVFLGRVDAQVKIRGHRVELGEIEAALAAHTAVKDAVVLALGEHLVAYVVPVTPGAASVAALQQHVGERLPEHMVPSSLVLLAALPLTPNGKVDRQALAAAGPEPAQGDRYAAPRSPVEDVMAGLWADVFGRERVGIHERFSDLGGHSLLAIQIVARARDAFQTQLPLRAIFEAPTVAGLSERVEAAVRDERGPCVPPITRASRLGPMPLSFSQERLWFLDKLDPGSVAYNIPARLRMTGRLDVGALARALCEIVHRHEVLRTTFATVDGKPAQVIHDATDLRLAVEDAGGDEGVREAAAAEMARPFDLAHGPLLRARLLRLSEDAHVLLLTMHHIVSDAWTKGVFLRELAALYEAFHAGRPSPLPELPVQYADYAAWQRSWLSGEALERQLDYWKVQLAGAPAALDLPTSRPRPAVLTTRGARRRFSLSPDVTSGIEALARGAGATLFMTMLAAFDVLLKRYTWQSDLVVGTPVAGRTLPEIEPLIGFFVNTLVIRVRLDTDGSFVDLLERTREQCLGAYAHQDVPFERLVTELAPERDLARTPLFQVVFTLQDAGAGVIRLPGLSLSGVDGEPTTSKFDLTLAIGRAPEGLLGSLEYNTDLFDDDAAERLVAHYQVLLAGIVAAPDAPLWQLPILPDAERRVLASFAAPSSFSPSRARHSARALHGPGRRDPRGDGGRLRRPATQLPGARSAGEPARPAPAPARRRPRVAGGPVCPALGRDGGRHPRHPQGGRCLPAAGSRDARRAPHVDARRRPSSGVVVAAGASAAGRPLGDAVLVDLAADGARIAAEPEDAPTSAGSGEGLAYVMYTSGSTGTPKGVCALHRGVVRLVKATSYARFSADEVFLQLAPIAFDAATLEIWGSLLNGARLAIFPAEPPTPTLLGEAIREHGVTTLWLTAGLFNAVIDESPEVLRPLRQLLVGGEALSVPHVRRALAELPGVQLINGYGPTEGTTFTCCHPIASVEGITSVPLGRPIANTRAYVLDEHLQPAPIGVPGELYIGGDGLARGYLNRPDLTADRFGCDPFGAEGARLYRTGDRVRWLADGTLAFLGRLDQQVKLRGFRIELGEVEAALEQHPALREAVVLAREDAPGQKRLVAYLSCREGAAAPTVNELRAFVRQTLPEVMVPAAFVLLDALPLTANGKIDRRALPAPEDAERLELGDDFVAPRSDGEEALARIWASVLRLPKVGIHDNFFASGGDSILSIQIVSRASAEGIAVTPRQLFQHQTVAELAAVVGGACGVERVVVDQGPVTGPVVLTPIQRWWLEHLPGAPGHYNQSLFLEVREPLDPAALAAAVASLLDHHDALRLRLVRGEDGWKQSCGAPGEPPAITVADLADAPEADLAAAIETAAATAQSKLDLAQGPVFCVLHVRVGSGRPERLLFVAHHLAVDGVSWRILAEDFWTAYDACLGAPRRAGVVLPWKTTSFQRWAERLTERAGSRRPRSGGRVLARPGPARAPPLPVDHERGDNTEASARAVSCVAPCRRRRRRSCASFPAPTRRRSTTCS